MLTKLEQVGLGGTRRDVTTDFVTRFCVTGLGGRVVSESKVVKGEGLQTDDVASKCVATSVD